MTAHWSDAPPDRVVTMARCPSLNALWVRAPGKPRTRSAAYRDWIRAAGWDVRRQLVGQPPIDCRFNVVIEVPITRRDTDNWSKATLDLCESVGLMTNDGNVSELIVRPVQREDVMVAIWCLPEMGEIRKQAKPRGSGGRVVTRKRPGLTWILATGTSRR